MSATKMPHPQEWAEERVYPAGQVNVQTVEAELRDFQRQTLLAAAEYVREQGLCYIAEKLERLAREEVKHG